MTMKHIKRLMVAALLAGAALFPSSPASATGFCHPKETPDGFVALRAGPGPSTRLIGRMKPRDEVLFGLSKRGDWIEATWWRGDDRHTKGYHRIAGKGWVNSRLIEEEC